MEIVSFLIDQLVKDQRLPGFTLRRLSFILAECA